MTRGRSVIVTGGASGLGKIMSAYFAARGDAVTILDINATDGAAVAAELSAADGNPDRQVDNAQEGGNSSGGGGDGGDGGGGGGGWGEVKFEKCDVTSWTEQKKAFKAVYERVGRVDVVVANAGVSEGGGRSWVLPARGLDPLDEPEEPRLKVLDVNLLGVVYSVKLALHYMQRNAPDATTGSRGSIICTASNVGLYPFSPAPLYAASKHAVVGLVRSLGPIYRLPHIGIRINALAPAVLESNISGVDGLFKNMIVTPPSTLIAGVEKLLSDTSLNGQVAEIHGQSVTLRPPHEVVDEDSRYNLEEFARFGYGQEGSKLERVGESVDVTQWTKTDECVRND
ncbi:15-hydroxyprostaglandin dehydrogenase [Xylaria sp. FL1042]|nr:15-hydroxyprostaglandin dehydrogenase [Xylaria sp. FL1042]